jgi:predicted dehydrogenase
MNVGVVGLGWAAGAHIETFKHVQGAQVTAVCSRRRLDPADLERTYGLPLQAYDDYRRMLADESIDVVDICSPPWLHAEQAIAAARAGKHVLLEKPIALRWDDAKDVRDAVRKAKV